MTSLVSIWEKGWFDPEVEAFAWKQLASAFSIESLCFAPKLLKQRSKPLQFHTVEEALEVLPGERVFLIPFIGQSLFEFQHPKDAVYIFGNASNGNRHLPTLKDKIVSIPTPKDIDIFGINAAAIVLADRERKGHVCRSKDTA